MTLKNEYKKYGFTYKQLRRSDIYALYAIFLGGSVLGYETIKVRSEANPVPNQSNPEEYERYPSTEQFGKYGWSYQNYDKALEKFIELLQEQLEKEKIKKEE